jgi:two-component system, NtrC family, sensor kinase
VSDWPKSQPTQGKRRTVLFRVLSSYVLVTSLFVLVAGYSVYAQSQSARNTEAMRFGYIPLQLTLRDAVAGQNTFNSQLNHITETKNPADKRVWFDTTLSLGRPKTFDEITRAVRRAFKNEQRPLGDELLDEVGGIQRFLEADREILSQLFQALEVQDESRSQELRDRLVTRGIQASIQLRNLEERVNLELDSLIHQAAEREEVTLQVLLLWAMFSVAFGAGVALYTRNLLKPLHRVTERAKAVAAGDLTPRSVSVTNDEIGELAQTFESMVAAIARANRELLDAERLATIGKMAAQVTHEVRNPLSSIGLNLELLDEELKSDEAKSLHAAISREVQRLNDLTEQYLSVARRNDPKFALEDFGSVIREAAAFVQSDLSRHGIDLQVDAPEGLPSVWLDEGQIRQVVHNLVRNARQATPRGGLVTLTARAVSAGVELRVADSGSGLDPEAREHLFEPFFTTKTQGTGLGLVISRHMVESHRGSIRCEANEPTGAVFVIRLPLDARSEASAKAG